MKKVVALLLTLGMLLTMLAGCGSTNNDAGGGKEDAGGTDGVIEVTFWHVLGGSLQEPVENLVKEFNETVGAENKIHVTPVYQGTDIMTVLTPVVQTDDVANMPDVANISFSSTMDMSNCEYVRWLEDLMAEDDTCSAQDYLANGAYSVSVNGRMAAAPLLRVRHDPVLQQEYVPGRRTGPGGAAQDHRGAGGLYGEADHL